MVCRSLHYATWIVHIPTREICQLKCISISSCSNKAVLAVGYGHYDPQTDPDATSDSVEGDYWLIKNSWGEHWGLNGCEYARALGHLDWYAALHFAASVYYFLLSHTSP